MAEQKKIYFLSDLHLGARYKAETDDTERMVCEFLMSIRDKAETLYLMGDILDYWFEYKTVVPRGYIRFFGALAMLADTGVKIKWYIGNHDIWLFDYLRDEIGLEVIDGYTVETIRGKKFFLNHGDGVGELPIGFKFIRWLFRNKVCQKLYSGVHPRWTIPFALGWSHHSRMTGGSGGKKYNEVLGVEDEPLAKFARDYLRDVDPTIDYFVFGHRHVVMDESLSPTCRIIILGDWIRNFSYGVYDGERFDLLTYKK